MKKLLLFLVCMAECASAQLPPAWQADTTRVVRDEMTRAYVSPQRIVWISDPGAVVDSRHLLQLSTGQAELGSEGMCTLTTSEGGSSALILDYGRELHGGLRLVFGTASRPEPSTMRIRFGESVSEACSEENSVSVTKGFSTNDHAMRDLVLKVPRDGQIELGNTGFRFVRIDLLEPATTLRLKEATAIFRYRNLPYLGSFRCSDERLTRIWETGAYTVHLNMQEYLWDGIKRDRLIWVGDLHPEMATILSVFGADDIVPRSLDMACRQFPLPCWLNDMSAYSMWYLIIHRDWYLHSGDRDFLERHRGYIFGLIDAIDACVDENGDEHLSRWRFLDWPSSPDEAGVEAGYRALLCLAMQSGEQLCETLGDVEHAARCRRIEACILRQTKPHNGLKQAAALMALAGTISAEDACREAISVGGAKGFSTFYGYYMLEAMARAGRCDEAMQIIRRFWGGMLDLGATTFWEDFNLDWTADAAGIDDFVPKGKKDIHGDFGEYCYPGFRHSLCHGWASGPTPWLTRYVLGIEVLEPGCRKIRITPHLGDLEWAEGSFPTPLGVIHVRHEKRPGGRIASKIEGPKGVKIIK